METPGSETNAPAKTNQRIILMIVAAILLCCGGLVVISLFLYGRFSIQSVQTQEFPTAEFPSVVTRM
jgi:hypothetical protein